MLFLNLKLVLNMTQIVALAFLYLLSGLKFYKGEVMKVYQKSNNFDKMEDLENEDLILANRENFQQLDSFQESGSAEGEDNGIFVNILSRENNSCKQTPDSLLCSGRGKCIDYECICDIYELNVNGTLIYYSYFGKYCEDCPYCQRDKCQQLLPCIECHSFQQDKECSSYCQYKYEIVKNLSGRQQEKEKICDIENSIGCYFKFKYYYDENAILMVEYQEEFSCFHGLKILIFTFWSVIIYIFALAFIVSRLGLLSKQNSITESRNSLSTGNDVIRYNFPNNT